MVRGQKGIRKLVASLSELDLNRFNHCIVLLIKKFNTMHYNCYKHIIVTAQQELQTSNISS